MDHKTENKMAEFQAADKHESVEQIETDLNAKIMNITMRIKEHYPELSPYLEEMPVTVPSENNPKMTLDQLKSYYESLNSLLEEYKAESPKIKE